MVRRDPSYTIHGSGLRAVHIILSLPAGGTPVRAVEGNRSRVCPRPQPGPRRRTLVAPLGARRRRLFGDDRRGRDLFLGLRGLSQASPTQVALLSSLPQLLGSFAQIVSAWWKQQHKHHKPKNHTGVYLQALAWLPLML